MSSIFDNPDKDTLIEEYLLDQGFQKTGIQSILSNTYAIIINRHRFTWQVYARFTNNGCVLSTFGGVDETTGYLIKNTLEFHCWIATMERRWTNLLKLELKKKGLL